MFTSVCCYSPQKNCDEAAAGVVACFDDDDAEVRANVPVRFAASVHVHSLLQWLVEWT